MLDLTLHFLTRGAWKHVCRAIESMRVDGEMMPREVVIVDTSERDGSIETLDPDSFMPRGPKYKFKTFNSETHPSAFLLDAPETFAGGPVVLAPEFHGAFTGRPFLSDFGAARMSGWPLTTSRWSTYLDSDDVWMDAKFLPEALAALDQQGATLAGLRYDYRRDDHGNVQCELVSPRLAIHRGSYWKGRMHESLMHERGSDQAVHLDGYGHVKDLNDLQDPQSRVHLRGWKAMYHQWLHGDRDPRTRFSLAMESRPVHPHFAVDLFAGVVRDLPEPANADIRAKALYESGLVRESIAETAIHIEVALQDYTRSAHELAGYSDPVFAQARVAASMGLHRRCLDLTAEAEAMPEPLSVRMQHNPMVRVWADYPASKAALALGMREEASKRALRLAETYPEHPRVIDLLKRVSPNLAQNLTQ